MFVLKAKIDGGWKSIGVASQFKDPNGNTGLMCELIKMPAGWNGRFIAVESEEVPAPDDTKAKAEKVPVKSKAKDPASNKAPYGDTSNPATPEEYEAGWRWCPRRRGGHLWNIYTKAIGLIPNPKLHPMMYPDSKCQWHIGGSKRSEVEVPAQWKRK